MQTVPSPVINDDYAALMQSGVSISIASCDRDNVPSLVRATGCRISPDNRRVTLFVAATKAAQVLADIKCSGAIAVVFSLPATHRTVQVKGRDAVVSALAEGDLEIVKNYQEAFIGQLVPFGYDEMVFRTILSCPPNDLVALSFTPAEAFSQTPGPKAGEPIGERA